ncbi:MAG: DUF3261 domain-containing protein [Treponema sp.]|nr:DUF3261 domain-containing protein [Treponema sp.]
MAFTKKIFKLINVIFLLYILFSLTSCLSLPASDDLRVQKDLDKVYVTNTKKIYILSPEYIKETIDKLYLMTFEFDSAKISLPLYVYADQSGIYLSILNDFGIDMGSLNFTDGKIDLDSSVLPQNLLPVYLINEFQNAFYQEEALAINLKNSFLTLQIENQENCQSRIIKSSGKIIEEIEISSSSIVITNNIRDYKISLLESDY